MAERHRGTPPAGLREFAIVPSRLVLLAALLPCLAACVRKKDAEIGVSTLLTRIDDGHTRHATLGLGTGSSIHVPARSIVTFIW